MNAARVARIHRALAKLHEQLADAMLEGEKETGLAPVAPSAGSEEEPSDMDKARARRALRRAGFRV